MQNTKIQWTDHTLNLWHGCVEVATGCENCYAAALSKRFGHDIWGADKPRKWIAGAMANLDKYERMAYKKGERHMVFVGSMMDIFEKNTPLVWNNGTSVIENTDAAREFLFALISDGQYPNLVFQFLTKRPGNIRWMIPTDWLYNGAPDNVWFGTSASTQKEYEQYTKGLMANTPLHSNLFLSLEPMVEPIEMKTELFDDVKWVIVGGESGNKARFFDPDWVTSILQKCQQQKVRVFVKQFGTRWARDSNSYHLDTHGGNPKFWDSGLAVRETMI